MSRVERAVLGVGVRRTLLGSVASIIVVVSCGGSVSDNNSTAGRGGSAQSSRPKPPKSTGGGGFGATFPGFGGGDCIELFTSSGTGPICRESTACKDFTSADTCEAAGCIATAGVVSLLIGAAGGNPVSCELNPDVFVSCEEGYGGAFATQRCNQACDACIWGGWTVPRSGDWPRTDCVWSCVDGQVVDAPQPPSCKDFTSTETCAAAGCIATTGDLSHQLGSGGYYTTCELTPNVFISCEEGYAGAPSIQGCNKDCDACIDGSWTVPRSGDWPRSDCLWTCVDGRAIGAGGGDPGGP